MSTKSRIFVEKGVFQLFFGSFSSGMKAKSSSDKIAIARRMDSNRDANG